MTLSKEQIGALFFLVVSILYGYYANRIKLYPGDEYEAMTAQTLPFVLSGLGIVLSLCLLIGGTTNELRHLSAPKWKHLNWRPLIGLMSISLLYGLALDWLGFLIATVLFLIAGFRILGEKRIKVLLFVSLPFVFGFWFGLTELLDIYLAPGRIVAGQ